jgi:hypothetical protein
MDIVKMLPNVPPSNREDGTHMHPFIEVTVNRKPVRFRQAGATGLEIKTTAIAQGVAIQTDFVLFLVLGSGKRQVIGDEDVLHLHPHSTLEAIPSDDNS